MAESHRWAGAALSLLLAGGVASAEPPPLDAPEFLEGMRQLEQELNLLQAGWLRNDYDSVRLAAEAIAESPDPPLGERRRIMQRAGAAVGAVSAAHGHLREAAGELAEAAAHADDEAILRHHQRMLQTCIGCHALFRSGEKPR